MKFDLLTNATVINYEIIGLYLNVITLNINQIIIKKGRVEQRMTNKLF
jgi:hypothetical protein